MLQYLTVVSLELMMWSLNSLNLCKVKPKLSKLQIGTVAREEHFPQSVDVVFCLFPFLLSFFSPSQNDLLFLKVTSQLHHLSIKCAIHVLHVNKFNPNCLKRRPSNEVSKVHEAGSCADLYSVADVLLTEQL